MSLLTNPIFLCASIALGIILLLIIVVVICCKKGSLSEREELMAISEEIESNSISEIETKEDKIEDVLTKMQESLDAKESTVATFEEEQEENAIISYQELLNSLGAKSNIDVANIELYEDELEGQIEISDVNKEIIDAYQKENLDKEIYRFQNDYSNEGLAAEVAREVPTFYDFSQNISYVDETEFEEENIETEKIYDFSEGKIIAEPISDPMKETMSEPMTETMLEPMTETMREKEIFDYSEKYNFEQQNNNIELSSNIEKNINNQNYFTNRKFKKSEIISPVYGIMNEKKVEDVSEIEEEIIFEDDSLLDEF